MTPYIYLFVRTDLSTPQQIVQTAHAVDELRVPASDQTHHMVLIGLPDQRKLISTSQFLESLGIKHELFFEPDVNEYTAIATHPLRGDERKPLRRYQLMR